MDNVTFIVGRQQYVAELELNEVFVTVTFSGYKSGEDHSLLDISWDPKTKWQQFESCELGISISVVKRALRIWDDYRKTAASKTLHTRKPKPAPKAMQVLRKQIKEAMERGDDERTDTLIAKFKRISAKTRVLLPVA
ncbi:MAG: hypothetical protein ABI599_13385 [Flavobacteriales bacterium]